MEEKLISETVPCRGQLPNWAALLAFSEKPDCFAIPTGNACRISFSPLDLQDSTGLDVNARLNKYFKIDVLFNLPSLSLYINNDGLPGARFSASSAAAGGGVDTVSIATDEGLETCLSIYESTDYLKNLLHI